MISKNKRAFLSSIYQTIYLGDIITRNKISNDFAVKLILKKIAESVTKPLSFSRLTNILKSTGLLGLMLLDSKSAQLENLVAIELIRRYGVENVFFFENNVEIDFYIPSESLAIQVSLQVLDDIDTKERETRAFAKLNNFIPDSKCILITNSEETNLEYDGIDIEVIPIWKWLLMADL